MKRVYLSLLLFINLNSFSQQKAGLNISFANNRICGGIDYTTKKGLGISVNGGLLVKDEFSINRGSFLERILQTKINYDFPFYDNQRVCYKGGYSEGYKVVFYGVKIHLSYNLIVKFKPRSKNYISFGVFFGIFKGAGYWLPTIHQSLNDTILCNDGHIKEQIGGWYSGIDFNYFISLDKSQLHLLSIGVWGPFYRPTYPNYYITNINTNPPLSGIEPEIKISFIKKFSHNK